MTGRKGRALQRTAPVLALPALVGVSTVLHWLAGRRLGGLWIMPDEGVYAAQAIALWRHGSVPVLTGPGAGYGVLYPILAGLPFAVGNTAQGYASLKLLQALVVSLAAVPVFVFGRRLLPPRYALLAAVLTVSSPLLLYSGLIMTEVLFYPLAAAGLLAVARAVATATVRDQAIAFLAIFAVVLTRAQGVIFVAVFAGAVLLNAAFARNRSYLRSFWPMWVVLGAAAAVLAAWPSLVGPYADTLRGSYPLASAVQLTFEHLAYVALTTGLVPFAVLVLMTARALLGRERDPGAQALLAVCVSATVLLVLQVGFFAARYAPHILGRDLSPLPPLLFLVFALWLARGAPRRGVSAAWAAFAVLSLMLLTPWNTLVVPAALADSFDFILLSRARDHTPANVVMVFSIAILLLFIAVPRRAALVLPAIVLAISGAASAVASGQLAQTVNDAQRVLGPDRSWIDRAAPASVAYLYDGEAFWNIVWQERFWNRRVDRVYSLGSTGVAGPMPQEMVMPSADGRLPLHERYVVASDRHTFVGTPVAHLPQQGLDVSGLTLWRLDGAPRLSTREEGVQPNGDMTSPARVTVYDCAGGRLELTLLPKATPVLRILLDGKLVVRTAVAGKPSWHGEVRVPSFPRSRTCRFTILPQPLLGSTVIRFDRRPPAPAAQRMLRK